MQAHIPQNLNKLVILYVLSVFNNAARHTVPKQTLSRVHSEALL